MTIYKKLKKIEMSLDEYNLYCNLLELMGYSKIQSEALIHQAFKSIVHALSSQYDSSLKALGFNCEQIIKIAAPRDGLKNLAAVEKLAPALKAFGLSLDQIVEIAGRNSGLKKLQVVHKAFSTLQGFSPEEIVKTVACLGGAKKLKAKQTKRSAFRMLKSSDEKRVKMNPHEVSTTIQPHYLLNSNYLIPTFPLQNYYNQITFFSPLSLKNNRIVSNGPFVPEKPVAASHYFKGQKKRSIGQPPSAFVKFCPR